MEVDHGGDMVDHRAWEPIMHSDYTPKRKVDIMPQSGATVTSRRKARLSERDGLWCYLCGEAGTLEELSVDHVIPSSRGGSNLLENLALACFRCNAAKGDMLVEEFEHWILQMARNVLTKRKIARQYQEGTSGHT
jgi:5-methylcytosine-specific restriction endonuclease McrA